MPLARLLLSWTRPWILYSTLWHSSNSRHLLLRITKTWEPNYILQWLQARYWLAWSPIWFEKVICTQRWPSTGCDQHKWYFGYLKKSALPRKKAYRDWTRMMVDYKCLLDERLVTQNGGTGGGDLTQLEDSVYVKEPGHSRYRLACSELNHYLNKWNSFLDWIRRNKFQQNANTVIFAEENAFENVVNIMATVLSQFKYVVMATINIDIITIISPILSGHGYYYQCVHQFDGSQIWLVRCWLHHVLPRNILRKGISQSH